MSENTPEYDEKHAIGPEEYNKISVCQDQRRGISVLNTVILEDTLKSLTLECWNRGQWFMKDGMRHIIGPDIELHRNKKEPRGDQSFWRTNPGDPVHDLYSDWRKGVVYYHESHVKNVEDVSEELYAARKIVGNHPSEGEWAVPRSHHRHLLNFPAEILDLIFAHTLVLRADIGSLSPRAITSNLSEGYQEACYEITRSAFFGPVDPPKPLIDRHNSVAFERGPQFIKKTQLSDESGLYIQLQRVSRRVVDATCLRACKKLHGFGSEMLYRQNTFTFHISDCHSGRETGEFLMFDQEGTRMDLNIIKPGIAIGSYGAKFPYRDWLNEVEEVVSQAEQQVSSKELKGWAYYDPFIRFLFVIGPQNAALIKTLQFGGSLKTHYCQATDQRCDNCGEDFLHHFMIYLQFIRKFCTGLEKLVLNICPDPLVAFDWNQNLGFHLFEIALTPFLKMHLRKLSTVKSLILGTVYDQDPDAETGMVLIEPMRFAAAVETCQWFEARAKS